MRNQIKESLIDIAPSVYLINFAKYLQFKLL